MQTKRHDWLSLESRWIAGEWKTLKEMAAATGVTFRMIQKRSWTHKWPEKRQAVEEEAAELARQRAIKNMANRLIEANERALTAANTLYKLGLRRFLDKRGRIKKTALATDATAIHAVKSAIQIEQAILRRLPLDDGAPGEGPIIPNDLNGMEDLTDAELARIARSTAQAIERLDKAPKPARKRKGGRRRAAKKAPSKS